MTTYIVKIESKKYIDQLKQIGQVGNPKHSKMIILESDLSKEEIQGFDGVIDVEEDSYADIDASNILPTGGVYQRNPGNWFLSWISNTNGTYEHDETGNNVDVYVIDTGVKLNHEEFEGRASTLWSYDGENYDPNDNMSPWHGTAVASCVAGKKYGTAKKANIKSLRIDWRISTIAKVIDIIIDDHINKPDTIPSIINFSGSSLSRMLGEIFYEAVTYGIVSIAAAGNNAEDEPRYPAKHLWTVAVGAIDPNGDPASFTNRECDVFSPGVEGKMAGIQNRSDSLTASGTSFSSPSYAGLNACALGGSDKFNSKSQVSDFNFKMRRELTDKNRVPFFDNGFHSSIRTASTKTVDLFYENESLDFTDEEIAAFIEKHFDNPQKIADAAFKHNVSRKRISEASKHIVEGGYTEEQVDWYFSDNNVSPWWFTDSEDQ